VLGRELVLIADDRRMLHRFTTRTARVATSRNRESAVSSRCQGCGTEPLRKFTSRGQVVMWRCPKCGLYQYGTLFAPEEYDGVYDHMYRPRLAKKVYTAAMRLNRVAAVLDSPRPHLLEIGCSLGATMEAARQRGWNVTGVDVSKDAVQFSRKRGFNCAAFDGLHLPFDDQSFDALTAWHVIEHVADVRETLAEWRRVLRPGGVLALETPDASSAKVRRRGAKYEKFWRIEHTYAFSPKNLAPIVEEAGFELVGRPLIGRLRHLTPLQAMYAIGHLAVEGLLYGTGNHKAFQVFARRIQTVPAAAAGRTARLQRRRDRASRDSSSRLVNRCRQHALHFVPGVPPRNGPRYSPSTSAMAYMPGGLPTRNFAAASAPWA